MSHISKCKPRFTVILQWLLISTTPESFNLDIEVQIKPVLSFLL